jgi:type II secretory pathway component PulF
LLEAATGPLPAHHRAVIEAGLASGSLDRAFTALAVEYEHAAREEDERRSALRPATILLAAAAVLLPLPAIVREGLGGYLKLALPAVAAATGARVALERWLLPRVLGGRLGRARLLRATALLISAGSGPAAALRAAAGAAGDTTLAARVAAAARAIDRGSGLAAALGASGVLDGAGVALVAQGERIGHMTDALQRAAALEEEAARHGRTRLVRVVGALFWAVAVLLVGYHYATAFVRAVASPVE